jgi:anaerobic selenocysteine-containing dehydrogenase
VRRSSAVAAALVAALAAAAPAAAADEGTRLAKARERWAEQHALDYTFRIQVTCFCPRRDPVKIRVRDGKPRGTPARLRGFDTIEELFTRIGEELDRGGDPGVRYAARTGAPRHFDADPAPRAIDDEYAITVRRVRITRRD